MKVASEVFCLQDSNLSVSLFKCLPGILPGKLFRHRFHGGLPSWLFKSALEDKYCPAITVRRDLNNSFIALIADRTNDLHTCSVRRWVPRREVDRISNSPRRVDMSTFIPPLFKKFSRITHLVPVTEVGQVLDLVLPVRAKYGILLEALYLAGVNLPLNLLCKLQPLVIALYLMPEGLS